MTSCVRAVLIQFPVRALFPVDDPLSVALLRLMGATNDVRWLQASALKTLDGLRDAGEGVERVVLQGDLGYILRMLYSHLHEAGYAFRDLVDHHAVEIDCALDGSGEARRIFEVLSRVYKDESEGGLRKYLKKVRDFWGFHYKDAPFRAALKSHSDEARIVIADSGGRGHYKITDDFAKRYMLEAAGSKEASQRLMSEAIDLAGELGKAVDMLLEGLLRARGVSKTIVDGEVRGHARPYE